mmetsp:Transcript_30302/g.46469  ORF Transcript_30302/g.46469 Transcript_30302/m.46469 type:complete len:268 (+) Transcript_30302:191-994(+)|eukprot:CAMPEP_0195284016 /NCGR_PEP_ID=MMETSP0707-20130614/2379_1 /TAXON_ID=33640 /ORGANISM="Asterionellopsis glacialis, Strain CCMP134" /LENGTH=267 /DNA_ID=CAMNT_0040343305 /DNA_START=110 /DNA_END=913 /DNA_ORIENTATION=-
MSEQTPRRANRSQTSHAHRLLVDVASSNASTGSSLSSSVSASVWSMPRAGRGGAQRSSGLRLTGGAKRAGTSFRVSLRPSSYRQRHAIGAHDVSHDGSLPQQLDECMKSICDPREMATPSFVRRIILALILSSLVATMYILLDPTRSNDSHALKRHGYSAGPLHDSLSIEDRVAQDEISGFSEVDVLPAASKTKTKTQLGPAETYGWSKPSVAEPTKSTEQKEQKSVVSETEGVHKVKEGNENSTDQEEVDDEEKDKEDETQNEKQN